MSSNRREYQINQHFIPQFYLKNFLLPNGKLDVFDVVKNSWEPDFRTTERIGYEKHNLSFFDESGKRDDGFDEYVHNKYEEPALGPITSARGRCDFSSLEFRRGVSKIIALISSRNPKRMRDVMLKHHEQMSDEEKLRVSQQEKEWKLQRTVRCKDSSYEYRKPSLLNAIRNWTPTVEARLMSGRWKLVVTPPNNPFITGDRPVFAYMEDNGSAYVTFPMSPTRAVVITNISDREAFNVVDWAEWINTRTVMNSRSFIISTRREFKGIDTLNDLQKPAMSD